MKIITSAHNQLVKDIKKLYTKKGRTKQNKYLLDGWHLVKEALLAKLPLQELLLTEESKAKLPPADQALLPDDYIQITPAIAQTISQTKSPQGIFATVALSVHHVAPTAGSWLLLDAVQDPGNIGTLVRTADAAGMTGVVFGAGCADMYHPKVIRAMQGSQFHVQLTSGDLAAWVKTLTASDIPVFGSELNPAAKDYRTVGRFNEFGLIMGNEGNGMNPELLKQTTANLYIPLVGKAESLNVGVAAGVLMFALHE